MTHLDDITAIRTRFLDAWADVTPVVIGSEPHPDQPNTAYVVLHVMPDNETRPTLGPTPVYEATGIVWGDVYAPSGEGDALAWNLADRLASTLRDWRTADGRVWVKTPSFREGNSEGKFMRIIVTLDYEAKH